MTEYIFLTLVVLGIVIRVYEVAVFGCATTAGMGLRLLSVKVIPIF
jgi:hypothetical protein